MANEAHSAGHNAASSVNWTE